MIYKILKNIHNLEFLEYIIFMIKVFNVKDLIKYFIKITIPLIVIFVITKTLLSASDTSINLKYESVQFFCLDDNIPQIKNNEKNEKIKENMNTYFIAQELHILKGIQKRRKK